MLEQGIPLQSQYQETAYIFASHMRTAKLDQRTIKKFSNTYSTEGKPRKQERKEALLFLKTINDEQKVPTNISELHQQALKDIKAELIREDQAYLEQHKGKFSLPQRTALLFKAKSNYLSGLNKEGKKQMYKEAGYTDEEINKFTGKKILLAVSISQVLEVIALAGRSAATVNEKMIPFVDSLPPNYLVPAIIGSMAAYTASFAWLVEKNLTLTKETGTSASPSVTGLYYLADKLFPDKARDWIARTPIVGESIVYNILYPLAVESATSEPHKILAGNIAATGLNLIFVGGAEVWNRVHKHNKRKVKENQSTLDSDIRHKT